MQKLNSLKGIKTNQKRGEKALEYSEKYQNQAKFLNFPWSTKILLQHQQINDNEKKRFNQIVKAIQVEPPSVSAITLFEHDMVPFSLNNNLGSGLKPKGNSTIF